MKGYKRLTDEDYTETEKKKHLAIVLCNMRKRCYQPTSNCYKNYGGRGIKVCEEWLGKDGQKNFYKWAIENGYHRGLSIDRIDNNGDYSPENCRWATPKTQAYNRSTNSYITIHGKTQTVAEWADEIGISRGALQNRLRYGWSEDRLLEPKQPHLKMSKHEMRVAMLKYKKEAEEYRTKIENGTLIELPCKVGDVLYYVNKYETTPRIEENKVHTIEIYECMDGLTIRIWTQNGTFYADKMPNVFPTKAEAQAKLCELQFLEVAEHNIAIFEKS